MTERDIQPPESVTTDVRRRPPLRRELRRIHTSLAALVVGFVCIMFVALGIFLVQKYTRDNLHLLARAIAHTVEVPLVFGDRESAAEALTSIAVGEPLAEAEVRNARGEVFARWEKPQTGMQKMWSNVYAVLLPPLESPLMRGEREIGTIRLRSDGSILLLVLFGVLGAAAVCLLVAVLASSILSRRILRDIVGPLQNMAQVTHAVRHRKNASLRVPPARIAELNEFGEDLNALLTKLAERQARLRRENKDLSMRVKHDSLTGLVNRATFERRLELALRQAFIVGSTYVGVLFIDCDHFKEINDTYGHACGDIVLQTVAKRLRSKVRESDTVSRFGGDEFGILLTALRNMDDVVRIADNIIQSMQEPVRLEDGRRVRSSVTVGVALFPVHAQDSQSLLRCADMAMYRAKRQRRGTVTIISASEAAQFNTSGFASLAS